MDWRILLFGPHGLLDGQNLLQLHPVALVQNVIFLRQKILEQRQPDFKSIPLPPLKTQMQELLRRKIWSALPPEQRYVRKTFYQVSLYNFLLSNTVKLSVCMDVLAELKPAWPELFSGIKLFSQEEQTMFFGSSTVSFFFVLIKSIR
jgi:hypothetical protein